MTKIMLQSDPQEFRANLNAGFLSGTMLGVVLGLGFGSILLGLGAGMTLGLLLGVFISRRDLPLRYPLYLVRRMLLTGTLFLLTVGVYVIVDGVPSKPGMILAALVPTSAGAIFVYSIGTAIASLDEMQRHIQTEALAIGFGGTVIILIPMALLELSGYAPINWGLVLLLMSFMWLIGKLWTKRRYG